MSSGLAVSDQFVFVLPGLYGGHRFVASLTADTVRYARAGGGVLSECGCGAAQPQRAENPTVRPMPLSRPRLVFSDPTAVPKVGSVLYSATFATRMKTDQYRRMKSTITEIIAFACLGAGAWAADLYTIDPAHSHVGFAVSHLVINTVHGKFNEFTGTVSIDNDQVKEAKGVIQTKT